MTRTYTAKPVWTWKCLHGLPTMGEMRMRGWFITESFGDKCPLCVEAQKASEEDS